MRSDDGDRPGGPQSPPGPHPNSPRPRGASGGFNYADLPAVNRRRVREVLGPAIREELAEYMAEHAAAHVRAA